MALLAVAGTADAHIKLTSPSPRGTDQKAGPCGQAGSTRGSTVTNFSPGETITVEWDETVDHPGHFRISFDDDGNDFENPNNPNDNFATTLVEPIADKPAGHYTQAVTLPATPCTNCTLQLVQVMTVTVPYNSFYFQCADITIGGGGGDAGVATPSTSGGCSTGSTTGGGCILVALAIVRRRRFRRSCRSVLLPSGEPR